MGRSLKSADVAVVVVVALAATSSITVRQPTLEARCTSDQFLIVDVNSDGTLSVLSLVVTDHYLLQFHSLDAISNNS